MPHHYDFSCFDNIKNLTIDIVGWKNPINIEYAYSYEGDIPKLYWRIKGTTHTFVISLEELNAYSSGDYELHFQQALTVFRSDILKWVSDGATEKWMREYIFMYKKFINF